MKDQQPDALLECYIYQNTNAPVLYIVGKFNQVQFIKDILHAEDCDRCKLLIYYPNDKTEQLFGQVTA